ncbi:hypothetical protein CAPTEDRAFT_195888 [Capitella teleta]|uniref:Uncharacterized protein n=1 Tax=Capitella teleta TaxID=283909 RepID=R7U5A0_CAPTE|nr:hypothetical protein CAPTEDRAFT_195888 [Capitella teleta]|eukprot:ELT98856.1 hypothetical protein CAPTEDRAFT_195888 [Capitella teleta]
MAHCTVCAGPPCKPLYSAVRLPRAEQGIYLDVRRGKEALMKGSGRAAKCIDRRTADDHLMTQADRMQAQSLGRLDNLPCETPAAAVDGASSGLYKCPSFPRIHGRMTPEARTFSDTTPAESDSISPRVSTDNLTGLDWDNDRLTLGGPVTLTRSVSARIVDSLPPAGDAETGASIPGNKPGQFLSPHLTVDGQSSLVSRSTSCPSMAIKRSSSASPLSPLSPQDSRRMATSADAGRDAMHAIQLGGGAAPMDEGRLPDSSGVTRTERSTACKSAFINIGDLASTRHSTATTAAAGLSSLPQTDRNVKVKCLQWLNSIDQDTDNEGDE